MNKDEFIKAAHRSLYNTKVPANTGSVAPHYNFNTMKKKDS